MGDMKSFTHHASVSWSGTLQHGKGTIKARSDILNDIPCLSGRQLGHARGTNAPELIAAAHASSFSMALANELSKAGHSPEQIDTTATVTVEDLAAGWTITQIHLDVIATVPGAAQCDFIDAALRAKINCPISRLLNANISMAAKMKRRAVAVEVAQA